MKPQIVLVLVLVAMPFINSVPVPQFGFIRGAFNGAREMYKGYSEMREANWKNSDKYFHAKANQNAAKHGPGGIFAAKVISNGREWVDRNIKGDSRAQSQADQRANIYGRNGGDLSRLRPKGLPSKY
ncbi:Serum amyloid A-3 protein [Armadillidium vulgare]|nr:Serum amyloid A-3 protein [Armadillidium vulgare]